MFPSYSTTSPHIESTTAFSDETFPLTIVLNIPCAGVFLSSVSPSTCPVTRGAPSVHSQLMDVWLSSSLKSINKLWTIT